MPAAQGAREVPASWTTPDNEDDEDDASGAGGNAGGYYAYFRTTPTSSAAKLSRPPARARSRRATPSASTRQISQHIPSPGPRAWKYHRSAHALGMRARTRLPAPCDIRDRSHRAVASRRFGQIWSMISLAWDESSSELEDVGVEKNCRPEQARARDRRLPMQLNLSGLGVCTTAAQGKTYGKNRRRAPCHQGLVGHRRAFATNVVRGFMAGEVWVPDENGLTPLETASRRGTRS